MEAGHFLLLLEWDLERVEAVPQPVAGRGDSARQGNAQPAAKKTMLEGVSSVQLRPADALNRVGSGRIASNELGKAAEAAVGRLLLLEQGELVLLKDLEECFPWNLFQRRILGAEIKAQQSPIA